MMYLKRNQRSRFLRSLFFLLIVLGLTAGLVGRTDRHPLEAASSTVTPNGAKWLLEFDFTQTPILSTITVEVGEYDGNKLIAPHSSTTQPIRCNATGKIVSHPEGLEFDGKSYLTCYFPDLQDIVDDLTKGRLTLASRCPAASPWIEGGVTIDPAASSTDPVTIFAHPDLRLATEMNSNQQEARMIFDVDHGKFWSDPFVLSGGRDELHSSLVIYPNRGYELTFLANQLKLRENGILPGAPLTISTGAAEITIGGSKNGDNFTGVISALRIDPPCIGGGI